MTDQTIVVSTPSGIAGYQLIALKHALRLEVMGIRTPMRKSGTPLQITERITGVRYRTMRQALAGVTQLVDDILSGTVEAPAVSR